MSLKSRIKKLEEIQRAKNNKFEQDVERYIQQEKAKYSLKYGVNINDVTLDMLANDGSEGILILYKARDRMMAARVITGVPKSEYLF